MLYNIIHKIIIYIVFRVVLGLHFRFEGKTLELESDFGFFKYSSALLKRVNHSTFIGKKGQPFNPSWTWERELSIKETGPCFQASQSVYLVPDKWPRKKIFAVVYVRFLSWSVRTILFCQEFRVRGVCSLDLPGFYGREGIQGWGWVGSTSSCDL